MTHVAFARGLRHVPVEQLQEQGVGLVTLDWHKVMGDARFSNTGSDPLVYTESAQWVEDAKSAGINVAIATNCAASGLLNLLKVQMPDVPFYHRGMIRQGGELRGKPHPDMLITARSDVGFGQNGNKAVHFDDQFKALLAAKRAGFEGFGWLYPKGNPLRQHPGVMLGRFIEVPFGAAYILRQNFRLAAESTPNVNALPYDNNPSLSKKVTVNA